MPKLFNDINQYFMVYSAATTCLLADLLSLLGDTIPRFNHEKLHEAGLCCARNSELHSLDFYAVNKVASFDESDIIVCVCALVNFSLFLQS